MKGRVILLLIVALAVTGCAATTSASQMTPPTFETGVDPNAWVTIPAGEYPSGQMSHMVYVPEFEIMVTDVTVAQYVDFLNEALAAGVVRVGEFEIEAGGNVWTETGVGGYYPGEPFHGYDHEEEIKPGDKLYVPLLEDGSVRITFDGSQFKVVEGFANHPMTMVSWFGANAYCEYYGARLPKELEWEKAARGTELVDGYGRAYPWGNEIDGHHANYYTSHDPFEAFYGNRMGTTTPVGFYNGRTYNGFHTVNAVSPYGLYDMAGNVWQWMGDDYPDQHYRHMRGGSFMSYEIDLRVWKFNSAGPEYYSPAVGFRCARD